MAAAGGAGRPTNHAQVHLPHSPNESVLRPARRVCSEGIRAKGSHTPSPPTLLALLPRLRLLPAAVRARRSIGHTQMRLPYSPNESALRPARRVCSEGIRAVGSHTPSPPTLPRPRFLPAAVRARRSIGHTYAPQLPSPNSALRLARTDCGGDTRASSNHTLYPPMPIALPSSRLSPVPPLTPGNCRRTPAYPQPPATLPHNSWISARSTSLNSLRG